MSSFTRDNDATWATRRARDALEWPLLADWYRRVTRLRQGTPDLDIKADILAAIHSGRLPAQADRIVAYELTPRDQFTVTEYAPLPREILAVGISGAGSLHIDWLRSSCVRRAGATWARIECENVRVDPERAAALWPDRAAPARAPATTSSTPPPERTVTTKELEDCILGIKKKWQGAPPDDDTL